MVPVEGLDSAEALVGTLPAGGTVQGVHRLCLGPPQGGVEPEPGRPRHMEPKGWRWEQSAQELGEWSSIKAMYPSMPGRTDGFLHHAPLNHTPCTMHHTHCNPAPCTLHTAPCTPAPSCRPYRRGRVSGNLPPRPYAHLRPSSPTSAWCTTTLGALRAAPPWAVCWVVWDSQASKQSIASSMVQQAWWWTCEARVTPRSHGIQEGWGLCGW